MPAIDLHGRPVAITDLHLHLEGSLAPGSAVELARDIGHPWGTLTPARLQRRFRFRRFDVFLDGIREMCRILASRPALLRAASELSLFLSEHGVLYAEVYCSPWVYVRWEMTWDDVLGALDEGFETGERAGGAKCVILIDTVRQWGIGPARHILGELERRRWPRVVGFGIGGEESTPLAEFRDVFERARDLGLRTVAHAGEIGPASDVADAIDILRVDRVAHGIRALDDPGLVSEIARRRVPLDIAITSNYRTGAVTGPHPIRGLLDAGVLVTIGTDDPSLFRTNPVRELQRARRAGVLSDDEVGALARNGIDASFASNAMRERLHAVLTKRLDAIHPVRIRETS